MPELHLLYFCTVQIKQHQRMIEIFKTDIRHKSTGKQVLTAIKQQFPGVVATLDLEDNDRILRVVGAWAPVPTDSVIALVKKHGFECELLPD